MKFLTRIVAFTLLLGLGSFFLVNVGVSADENSNVTNEYETYKASSIPMSITKEIPMGGSFPSRIWYTQGDYGGYLTLDSYEKTPNYTYKGIYSGRLYLHAAPNKLIPDEQ